MPLTPSEKDRSNIASLAHAASNAFIAYELIQTALKNRFVIKAEKLTEATELLERAAFELRCVTQRRYTVRDQHHQPRKEPPSSPR